MFPWLDLALRPEHILQDGLFALAKRINLRYAHIYGGVEETARNREAEWDKLDAFTRYSNISCADYHDIRLEMLRLMGLPADGDQFPPDKMELLAELEHIRWCRYHYLNNWRRGAGENGKKDPAAHLHPDLIPYEELTEPPLRLGAERSGSSTCLEEKMEGSSPQMDRSSAIFFSLSVLL